MAMNRSIDRRGVLRALLAAACLTTSASVLSADAFPGDKTINLVSWSAAGSPKDVMARQVAKTWNQQHGWNVVVTDMVGGGGAVALQYLLKQPADGYTVIAASGSMEVALATTLKRSFKVKDFAYVSQIQTDPFVLAVAVDSPLKTLDDLIKSGQSKPVTISGFGSSSEERLAANAIAQQGKFKMNWVPYGGGSEAITAAMGHNADAVLANLSEAKTLVRSGRLRMLAATTEEPLADPATPSFKSLGYHDMVRSLWRGFIVKAGTDPARIAALDKALAHLVDDSDYVKYTRVSNIEVAYLGPDAFAKKVAADVAQAVHELQ
jgi:tripartite-type tricarboxylate transporter receptor subunit TctC